MDRRTFVKSTLLGSSSLLLPADRPVLGDVHLPEPPPIEVHGLPGVQPSHLGMPGLYPGRVVQISASNAITSNRVSQPVVGRMIEELISELMLFLLSLCKPCL